MFRALEAPSRQDQAVRIGNLIIDLCGPAVLRGGIEVWLSVTEYALLSALATGAGQVMDRALLREVWGQGYGDERHYLRTFVHRLRAKLDVDPRHPEVIVTVGQRGYRLGPPRVRGMF